MYRRLKPSGYTRTVLHSLVLPDWWDDAIAYSPAGYGQLLTLLSRHLGLDVHSLDNPLAAFESSDAIPARLKKRRDATDDDLFVSLCAATRAAQFAVAATTIPYVPVPSQAALVRRQITSEQAGRVVTLEAAIDFCWGQGIPVIHLPNLPGGNMDGIAAMVAGRPAIVLLKQAKFSAELLFVLAHELGHISCDHLQHDDLFADVDTDGSADAQEREANDFATSLLLGPVQLSNMPVFKAARPMLKYAQTMAAGRNADTGATIRYLAMLTERYDLARRALEMAEPGANAPALVQAKAARHLDFDRLPPETSEYLRRATNLLAPEEEVSA